MSNHPSALGDTIDIAKLKAKARRASPLLKSMSNPHRFTILCLLSQGDLFSGDLERLMGMSQSTVSQHLSRLRRDGLVERRRDGQKVFYSLSGNATVAAMAVLDRLFDNGSSEPIGGR